MKLDLSPDEDAEIVRNLIAYDDAKRAYKIAKKIGEADLAKVANKEGHLSATEDELMRASAREAQVRLVRLRELLGN